jgi:hypothetical protein
MKNLNTWIKLVEATGGEVGLTFLVSGVVITGTLTPWARYAAWSQEVLMRTLHEGGKQALPSTEIGPVPRAMTEKVRAEWESLVRDSGEDPDTFAPEFPQFALRDVEIRTGLKGYWPTMPYLVVNTSEVAAFMPGTIAQPQFL